MKITIASYFFRFVCCLVIVLASACADLRSARKDIEQQEYESALEQFETLKDKGFDRVNIEIARLYSKGLLGEEQKFKALEFYEAAYNDGHKEATFPLAKALMEFSDKDEDKIRGAQLVKEAADANFPGARYAYANLLLDGQWLEQDVGSAVAIYRSLVLPSESAPGSQSTPDETGSGEASQTDLAPEPLEPTEFVSHAAAAEKLGKLYRDGILVPRDLLLAQQFLAIAWQNQLQRAGIAYARLLETRYSLWRESQTADADDTISPVGMPDGGSQPAIWLLDTAESLLRTLSDDGNLLASYRLALLLDRRHEQLPGEAADLYILSVSAGFTDAKLRLADIYLRGEGVAADPQKAIAIYRELSQEGRGTATARLGDIYRDGEHLPLNYTDAYDSYQLALEQGFERAEVRLAFLLGEGLGIERDIPTAYELYEKHAQRGDANSAYQISKLIALQSQNEGADQSQVSEAYPEKAWKWLEQAAEAGLLVAKLKRAELRISPDLPYFDLEKGIEELNEVGDAEQEPLPKAEHLLGSLYWEGDLVTKDEIKARDYLEEAVSEGFDQAKLKLADIYSNGSDAVKNYARASEILREFVAKGDAEATYKLARLMEQQGGDGAITPQLVELYRTSAELGYPPAQIRFADLLLDGNGIEQNRKAAIDTFVKLSEKGVGAATFRLGKLHEFGVSRELSDKIALGYYQKSIEEGYLLGNLKFAQFLYQGRVVEKDYERAKNLLLVLVNEKYAKAAFQLAEMYRQLRFDMSDDWFQEVMQWYSKSAEMGYLEATYVKATFLEELLRKRSPQATLFFYEAAQKGHGKSMLEYGARRFYGEFTPVNQLEGLTLVITANRLQTKGALPVLLDMIEKVELLEDIESAWLLSEKLMSRLFVNTAES